MVMQACRKEDAVSESASHPSGMVYGRNSVTHAFLAFDSERSGDGSENAPDLRYAEHGRFRGVYLALMLWCALTTAPNHKSSAALLDKALSVNTVPAAQCCPGFRSKST